METERQNKVVYTFKTWHLQKGKHIITVYFHYFRYHLQIHRWRYFLFINFVIRSYIVTFLFSSNTSSQTAFASITEQVGQEILANLHGDREKIQRARERVSAHMLPAHTHLSGVTSVCEMVTMLELASRFENIRQFCMAAHTLSWVCLYSCYVGQIAMIT